jgi:hypothetical protein
VTDFKDQMIEAVERGECSEDEAYDHVRDSLADAADRRKAEDEEGPITEGPTGVAGFLSSRHV